MLSSRAPPDQAEPMQAALGIAYSGKMARIEKAIADA